MKIDIPDLPGNSNMQKAQEVREARRVEDDVTPKRRAIVKGHVQKETSKISIMDLIIKQDLSSAASFAFEKVVIPKIQNLIVDTMNSIVRGIFLGENAIPYNGTGIRNRPASSFVDYSSIRSQHGVSTTTKASQIANSGFKYNIVTFDSYGDAQLVLDQMEEMLSAQGYVSIADMYECVDASCPYTYNYHGWNDISKAKIMEDNGQYWIKLPRAHQIRD